MIYSLIEMLCTWIFCYFEISSLTETLIPGIGTCIKYINFCFLFVLLIANLRYSHTLQLAFTDAKQNNSFSLGNCVLECIR